MNLWLIIIVIFIALVVGWVIHLHLSKSVSYSIDDLITRDGKHLSTTKILQLVGGVVATWVLIKMATAGTMTWEIFALYLLYVASVDGFSKALRAKFGGKDDYGYYGSPYYGRGLDRPEDLPPGSAKTPEV